MQAIHLIKKFHFNCSYMWRERSTIWWQFCSAYLKSKLPQNSGYTFIQLYRNANVFNKRSRTHINAWLHRTFDKMPHSQRHTSNHYYGFNRNSYIIVWHLADLCRWADDFDNDNHLLWCNAPRLSNKQPNNARIYFSN